jgi:hypothetical protein
MKVRNGLYAFLAVINAGSFIYQWQIMHNIGFQTVFAFLTIMCVLLSFVDWDRV